MKSVDQVLKEIKEKSATGGSSTKMLVVFPHPDDESVMAGGMIQRAQSEGFDVTVLILTEGDRGKIHVNGRGRSVAEIRRQEMALAMSRLQVVDWIMWKFDDGKLRQKTIWRDRLKQFISDTKPGLIVTYDLSGVTGHPDHVSASLEVLRVARTMKHTRLIWVSFEGFMKEKIVDSRVKKYLQQPRYLLNLNLDEAQRKWRAVFAHRSQGLGGFLGSPWWILMFVARQEWYSEADTNEKYKYKFTKFRI